MTYSALGEKPVRFIVGCDLEEFKAYYMSAGFHKYFKAVGITDVIFGQLGPTEERIIKKDPSHLIVWRENSEIVGHAIWHEECIGGFRKDPRDKEVAEVLERLLEGKEEFIELHEVWLEEKYRGKGHGKKFFGFFENFARKRLLYSIVYYTGNSAAIAICRKRWYKEEILSYPEKERWHVFYLSLK